VPMKPSVRRAHDRTDHHARHAGLGAGLAHASLAHETEPQTVKAFKDIARRFEAKNRGAARPDRGRLKDADLDF
jgi:hypothetical protein